MSTITLDQLNEEAMKIILHAGDAKLLLNEAFTALSKKQEKEFHQKMNEAQQKIIEGHKVQTKCLQAQMELSENIFSVLLAHAQDTIMTVKSEYEMIEKISMLYLGGSHE